jgi:hypothetical protein
MLAIKFTGLYNNLIIVFPDQLDRVVVVRAARLSAVPFRARCAVRVISADGSARLKARRGRAAAMSISTGTGPAFPD